MAKSKDRDKFGHCVRCHTYLLREVIDRGNIVLAPTPNSDSEMLLLNDGTQMRIIICRECKQELKDSDFPYIMDAVIKGWDWETDQLLNDYKKPQWDQKKKKDYMDFHKKLKIVTRPEGLSKAETAKRLKKFKSKKVEK